MCTWDNSNPSYWFCKYVQAGIDIVAQNIRYLKMSQVCCLNVLCWHYSQTNPPSVLCFQYRTWVFFTQIKQQVLEGTVGSLHSIWWICGSAFQVFEEGGANG